MSVKLNTSKPKQDAETLRERTISELNWQRQRPCLYSPVYNRGRPGFNPGQSTWDMLWTSWHWDRRLFLPILRFYPVCTVLYCSLHATVAQTQNCSFALNTAFELKIYNKHFDNNSTVVIQRGIFELTSQPVHFSTHSKRSIFWFCHCSVHWATWR